MFHALHWRTWPMSWSSLTFHSALNMLKRGLHPQTLPQSLDGKAVDIIAPRWLFSLCSEHAWAAGFVFTSTRSSPLLSLSTLHSDRLCTEWCHGRCVYMAIASDMLYVCASYSHSEGSRGERIFLCLKGQWKRFTKDPSFTQAILGTTWEQGVHSLTGQSSPVTIKTSA